jgi:hypothetical protein
VPEMEQKSEKQNNDKESLLFLSDFNSIVKVMIGIKQ